MRPEKTVDDHTVYITPRRERYHTDPDCRNLTRAQTITETRRPDVSADTPVCRICSGEYTPSSDGDSHALRRKLEAMDPDELGMGNDG